MEKRKAVPKNIAVSRCLNKRKARNPRTSKTLFGDRLWAAVGSKRQQTAARILDPTESHPTDADRSMASKLTSHPATIHLQTSPNPDFSKIPFRVIGAAQGDGGQQGPGGGGDQ